MPKRKQTPVEPTTPEDFVTMWYQGQRFSPQVYEDFGFLNEADVIDSLGKKPDGVEIRDEGDAVELVYNQMEQMGDYGGVVPWWEKPYGETAYDYFSRGKPFQPTKDQTPDQKKFYEQQKAYWDKEAEAWKAKQKKWDEESRAGYYKRAEVESFLQDIRYEELPESVRTFFEQEFAGVIAQHPELMDYVRACRIDFKLKGPAGQSAEHLRAQNRIEWYGSWAWDVDYVSKLKTPEQVRQWMIDKYLNMTMVHELTHVVQDFFKGQHPDIAAYPDEEHPEYREFGDVYHNDPGEQHATGVAKRYVDDTIKKEPFKAPRFYSLLSFRKVFGKV